MSNTQDIYTVYVMAEHTPRMGRIAHIDADEFAELPDDYQVFSGTRDEILAEADAYHSRGDKFGWVVASTLREAVN